MPSMTASGEYTSEISGGTVTMTPSTEFGWDTGTAIVSVAITSTNPPSDFFEGGRKYRIRFERI